MRKRIKKLSKKKGLKPGSIVFVGEKKIDLTRISLIDYDKTTIRETTLSSIEECFPYKDTPNMSWINIDGLHDISVIEKIGKHFNINDLILEDIVNTGLRPKIDVFEDFVFIVIKMLHLDSNNQHLISEQVSFIFGKNYVISFQECIGDVFELVRERLRKTTPRKRFMTSEYLTYTLIDAVIDHYYTVLENIDNEIEELEEILINRPSTSNLETIHDLKRQLIHMRKATWPLREVIGGLERVETNLIDESMKPFFRDLYEHTIQVIDSIETFKEMVSALLDIYLSSISNKMNEVMKVLTIISTIFIPLSFFAGVYGMNFDTSISKLNMPELSSPYGYIIFWVIVIIVSGGLIGIFKKKKWL